MEKASRGTQSQEAPWTGQEVAQTAAGAGTCSVGWTPQRERVDERIKLICSTINKASIKPGGTCDVPRSGPSQYDQKELGVPSNILDLQAAVDPNVPFSSSAVA